MNSLIRMARWGVCLAAFAAIAPALSAAPLPNDSRILSGKLPNGVKWMYREHANPPGKMALMMHVNSGSLNEADAQRGLAHFIEHMCFNGTENFPPGKLIPYFESIGMEFGPDLNAFTSFDQTSYMLFTPNVEPEQIDKALTVMSDYAFRALLVDEEIEKERGVVLEEARSRKSAFQRIMDKLWPELFEGSRFGVRIPIGDEQVLATAKREQFVDYYRTWYRPENVTIMLVGDAKPEVVTPLIEKWFGTYKAEATPRKELRSEFKLFTRERAIVVTDPEMAFCDVDMTNIGPARPPTTTAEQWRTELVERIGTWIVNRRYQERVNKGEASFRNADASVRGFFNDALLINASASGEPADWAKMLDETIVEVNRAREFGFTERELNLARKELLAEAEHAVETESTRNAQGIIRQMNFAVNNEEPVLSAQQELDLFKELLPSVQLAEVSETFKKHFTPGTFAYVVTMKEAEGIKIPSRDEVLAAAKAAWTRKVEPIKEEAAPTDLLAKLPTPGKVVESKTDADLGITSAWLDNGARVHHRFMDYKKETVMVSISLAGGDIEETAKNTGITDVALLAVQEAATSRLTSTQMRDLMTGKNIEVGGSNDQMAAVIEITGSPKDLEAGLQKAHALLTDGKIEEAAFKNWKLQTLQQIDMLQKMPRFKAAEATEDLLSGGDPRRAFPTKESVEAVALADAQAWFTRLCREAPIEVAVVGDIKLEEAMPLVEKYIGSLPKRSRNAEHLNKLRKLSRSTGPLLRDVKVETVTPQAMTMAGFMGTEGRNIADTRAMELASETVSSRLIKKVREELAIVYSLRGNHNPSWIYEDSGRFQAGAPCDPANAARVADEIHKIYKDFADNGPTAEELENAKKQVANNLDTEMREPRFWWGVLRHHDLFGRDLNELKAEKEAYQRFTAEQVQKVFKKYYTPERQFRVTAVPTGAPAGEVNDKAGATPATP
ncbi:MAG: insulinase family protein [Planctomycetes bacterium]|nr:insulinase family protein [Planctomycetota bacterium]